MPDLGEAGPVPRRRARLRVPLHARPVPARRHDWMTEHLGVHPRAVMQQLHFYRCGGQAIFEVFQYAAPDQARRPAAQQRHRRPPRRALRRRPGRRPCAPARPRRRRARRAHREQRPERGPALGLLPGALGHAVRARLLPRRQGLRSRRRHGATADDTDGGIRCLNATSFAPDAAVDRARGHRRRLGRGRPAPADRRCSRSWC